MQPLNRGFNVAVKRMAEIVWPLGFDVSPEAPATYEAMIAEIDGMGRLTVDSANSDTTIYADAETNYAARAWHDWTHWRHKLPFGLFGEIDTCWHQLLDLEAVYGAGSQFQEFRPLLITEVVGQAIYAYNHGGAFPTDQLAFTHAFMIFASGVTTRHELVALAMMLTGASFKDNQFVPTGKSVTF